MARRAQRAIITPLARVARRACADADEFLRRLSVEMGAAAAGRSEQLDVLVVFAGADDNDQTLPAQLRGAGHRVLAIDTRIGGASHDVLRHDVQQALLYRVRARRFHAVFLAQPCSSY